MMSDPAVEKWRQTGRIWLWRYTGRSKNFEGLHLTADPAGCSSMRELFKRMNNARWPSRQTLQVSTEQLADMTGSGYKRSLLDSLAIHYRKDEAAVDYWNLEWDTHRKKPVLSIGAQKLLELDEGVADIARGQGDYAIGPEDDSRWDEMCLWFWWHTINP